MLDRLKVKIDIKDLDIFIDIVKLLKEITEDIRIEESIREEYRDKLLDLSTKVYK